MKNQNPSEYFWDSIHQLISVSFGSLRAIFHRDTVLLSNTETRLVQQFWSCFENSIPAIQVQAVEALMSLDMGSEDYQWEVLEDLFREEKNFDHLRSAFDEYISTYALYVHELLPHQKTMLIKKAIELYPEIDRISFNV